MKWLDLFISSFAPRFAIKRIQARQGIRAYYEAAKPSRLRNSTKKSTGSADNETKSAVESLRSQARQLEQNYDIARGVLDTLVNNIVGLGITPSPQIMTTDGKLAEDVIKQLLSLWKDWVKVPEVTHEHSYYSLQRLVARTWVRDGELLTQFVEGTSKRLDHGTRVPMSLELIESDQLPVTHDSFNNSIVQGVQKNQWGRPLKYFIYKENPNDSIVPLRTRQELKAVNANKMLHIKMVDRIRQTRGISVFASVMNRFNDIKEIEESERVAARVAAAMTGFIKKGSPDMYIAPESDDTNDLGEREMDFAPGMIYDNLEAGEEVGTISSNRPNNELIPFIGTQLKGAAAGTGTTYSSISKDFNGTYSSQRQELAEGYVTYGGLWLVFKDQFCTPVWERFVRNAILAGLVEIPDTVDKNTLFDVTHSRPSMISVDPAKEFKAIKDELELRISSRSQVQRRRGNDPDEVRAEIRKEREQDAEDGHLDQMSNDKKDNQAPGDKNAPA